MCNMQISVVVSVIFALASIGSTSTINGILEGVSTSSQRIYCTTLAVVPLYPTDPYYKVAIFPSLKAKLKANKDRFHQNLFQVWVDAPNSTFCDPSLGKGYCVLNGRINPNVQGVFFESDEEMQIANQKLLLESNTKGLPYYKAYGDAPNNYCKRSG